MRMAQMRFQPMTDEYHAQRIQTDHKLVSYILRTYYTWVVGTHEYQCFPKEKPKRIANNHSTFNFWIHFRWCIFFLLPEDQAMLDNVCVFATELSDCRNNSNPVKYHAFTFIYGSMMLFSLLCGKLYAGQRYFSTQPTANSHCACCFGSFNNSELISWESLSWTFANENNRFISRYFPCAQIHSSTMFVALLFKKIPFQASLHVHLYILAFSGNFSTVSDFVGRPIFYFQHFIINCPSFLQFINVDFNWKCSN